MSFFRKTLDRVNALAEYAVCALLAVMVVVVFLQVIFRFIIRSSLPWSEELSRYVMVWIVFLGASIGIKRKSHIGVEVVVDVAGFDAPLDGYSRQRAVLCFLRFYGPLRQDDSQGCEFAALSCNGDIDGDSL